MGSDIVSALDRFFADLIGTVVPGALLATGLFFVIEYQGTSEVPGIIPPTDLFGWAVFLAAAYTGGHALTSVGHRVLLPLIGLVTRTSYDDKMARIADSQIFKQFVTAYRSAKPGLTDAIETGSQQVHTWRNLALSEVDTDQAQLVRKFTFIALFNLGNATALSATLSIWLLLNLSSLFPRMASPSVREINWWIVAAALLLIAAFIERHGDFQSRTMRVPFSMALRKLESPQKQP